MSKTFMTKHKTLTAIIAASLALIIMLGGTFAWQSINQTALNEVYSTVNPGGRLHDDYVEITYGADGIADFPTMTFNKDVYVENFTSLSNNGVQVYARVRLDEYMEIGKNAGQADSEAKSVVGTATLNDKNSWTTHIMNNDSDPFHKYWEWDLDGQTKYMPTFNKDKNSLDADINGVFPNFENTYTDYAGVTDKFADVSEKTDDAIYERNPDGTTKKSINETHTVKDTLTSTVISMAAYQEILADGNPHNDTGDYWVWDTDGWAYWANPILPDTATGLLLDEIKRTDVIIDEDWYYAINVVAQFITKDDIGYENNTGFYADGETVSANALTLLEKIGVQVTSTEEVNNGAELTNALAQGKNVSLGNEINGGTTVLPWGDEYSQLTSEYFMSNGGTLTGSKLILNENKMFGLVIEAGADSKATSVLKDIAFEGNSESLVYIGENGGKVILTDVDVTADGGSGIYAEFAQGGVELNNCTVVQNGIGSGNKAWFETAIAAAQGAEITINGGTYKSSGWAVYCFEGNNANPSIVTINGGTFIGKLQANNNDKIIIKGGSFSVDPTAFLAEGYTATLNETTGMYDVK